MRVYGYARVSSKEQNLDRQLVELQKYVEDRFIFTDKVSGKDMDRVEYQLLRKVSQRGDTIFIKSLDRLGRNKQQIKDELEYYRSEGVRVKILDIPTSMMEIPEGQDWIMDMINNLLIEVLSTIAEQERASIKARQAEGIAVAKSKGKHLGRPVMAVTDKFMSAYKQWKAEEITAVKAIELSGISKATFYRKVKEYELEKG